MSRRIEVEAVFRGRVQGVGFRWQTERVMQSHDVGGYVKNLPDGRVELLLHGEEGEVEAALQSVERALSRYIDDFTCLRRPPPEQPLTSFQIRY